MKAWVHRGTALIELLSNISGNSDGQMHQSCLDLIKIGVNQFKMDNYHAKLNETTLLIR